MKYIENISDDVYFNLALEDYIFHNFKDDTYLLLWENDRSIVLGRNQNVFEEINIKLAEKMGIRVARRNTGGGTVFHDKGNLNYSFITDYNPDILIDYERFINPVISALSTLGVKAEKKGSSDIVIDGKKISGSAQITKGGRVLHHGTLLFDAELDILHELLKTTEGEIVSKSVKSRRSNVTNIKGHMLNKDADISGLKQALLCKFSPYGIKNYILSDKDSAEINKLVEDKYSKWEWNFGNSPKFSYKKVSELSGKSVAIELFVEKGIISSCEIAVDNQRDKAAEEAVTGCRYSINEVRNKLENLNTSALIKDDDTEKLTDSFF